MQRTCVHCGATFTTTHRRATCSETCRLERRRRAGYHGRQNRVAVARECVVCGTRFQADDARARYCRKACRWKAQRDAKRERRRLEVVNCLVCETPFHPSEGFGKYDHCSQGCYRVWRDREAGAAEGVRAYPYRTEDGFLVTCKEDELFNARVVAVAGELRKGPVNWEREPLR